MKSRLNFMDRRGVIRVLALAVLLVSCPLSTVRAQEEKPGLQLPEGPLLRPAPEVSQWIVSYSYPHDRDPQKEQPAQDDVRQVTTTRAKGVMREELSTVGGQNSETWHSGNLQYRRPLGDKGWYQSSAPTGANGSDSGFVPMPANGFRDFDWIGPKTYAGTVPLEGDECLVFVPGGAQGVDLTDAEKPQEKLAEQALVAYVSAETRLPVALRVGEEMRRYRFLSTPATPLTLPTDLLGQIRDGQEARARVLQPATRPY